MALDASPYRLTHDLSRQKKVLKITHLDSRRTEAPTYGLLCATGIKQQLSFRTLREHNEQNKFFLIELLVKFSHNNDVMFKIVLNHLVQGNK